MKRTAEMPVIDNQDSIFQNDLSDARFLGRSFSMNYIPNFKILALLAGLTGYWAIAATDRSTVNAEEPADPKSIRRVEGFHVDLLTTAQKDQDSWISMCFDDQGRIILGLDRLGVGRLTLPAGKPTQFKRIENTLKHCRGVLYAYDSLYVDATDSQKLVRLNDLNGDGVFETRTELIQFDYRSRYGHGSNQMRLGPDGLIYVVIGNDVAFPADTLSTSPYRNPQNDWLIPETGDIGQDNRVGFIFRMDEDGNKREVVAGGFRNQVDMDFDANGEMFTFDADMEWDIGAPWYRPIRVNHIVSGGEYGWRWGSGKWPSTYPDSLPTSLDMGMGSPTGVVFGTRSNFPNRFKDALFLADWQNGKILTAHKKPNGASYLFEFESFLDGAPLNVCDMEFGPDGNLYFITGGRGSQSALYRVSWTGQADKIADQPKLNPSHTRRRQLESYHQKPNPAAVTAVWNDLGNPDPWIRHAARIGLERQPVPQWENQIFSEDNIDIALTGLIAIVRMKTTTEADRSTFQKRVIAKLASIADQNQFHANISQRLMTMIRICGILFSRHGHPESKLSNQVAKLFAGFFPNQKEALNCELLELLVFVNHSQCYPAAFDLLESQSQSQESQIHIARSLAHIKHPWPAERNKTFINWLEGAKRFRGGHLLQKTMQAMQKSFLKSLTPQQKKNLVSELAILERPIEKQSIFQSRELVARWNITDLKNIDINKANIKRGREIYLQAQCSGCHRKNDFGGQIGPDISALGKRYNLTTILESIIEPSKQIDPKYALSSYALVNGKDYTGRVNSVNKTTLTLETNPLSQETIVIQRSDIVATKASSQSPMPTGLLDYFTRDEIADLLAYLSSPVD